MSFQNVKSLTSQGERVMPKVRVLKLNNVSEGINRETLSKIKMPNLESLSICKCDYIEKEIFNKKQFKNLKTLKVLGVKDDKSPSNDDIRKVFNNSLIIIRS